ncbi:hypothetical protein WJX84_002772 [Apatococcus fuscideae]|uniref:RecF/RecN/SMC N-terminal domain-containing protein n=1 Tax=Apatococcus fuscideae TaxID=2026836 RepID=A0AAW1TB34_9CHLO
MEHELKTKENSMGQATQNCWQMEKDYPWITSEREHFGKRGTDYDWSQGGVEAKFDEYRSSRERIEKLGQQLNKKVLQMIDKAEEEYQELSGKKDIVSKDKAKIHKVIAELDEKKQEALQKTWTEVNQKFGSIFSTLLPSTSAKLEPQEGRSFLDGLEVRVAFGEVWKESLTELSGGQRSLLALSLILALLLFKPAPLYILDEVDAALDLSHTQNIGRMIRAHFPYSQFIVVSLKEGMFNNANVIYRTKFLDGVSTVTRTSHNAQSSEQGAQARKGVSTSTRRPLAENVR